MGNKVLLLGGAGFLGKGLARSLRARGRETAVIDRVDCDFADAASVLYLARAMTGFSHVFLLASQVGKDLFESTPAVAGAINRRIYDNVMTALLDA